jgi:hypothetical protein
MPIVHRAGRFDLGTMAGLDPFHQLKKKPTGIINCSRPPSHFSFRPSCRCAGRVAELPGECHVCGLTLISSPHLARSYHHLFPVPAYEVGGCSP